MRLGEQINVGTEDDKGRRKTYKKEKERNRKYKSELFSLLRVA
jgi:hypothetical protein